MTSGTKRDTLYSLALEQSRISFFLGEENGRILYANQAWKDFTGQKGDRSPEQTWFESFTADKDLILERKDATLETELTSLDGEQYFVDLMLHSLKSPDDGRTIVACFVIDSTEHKQQIQEIQISALHDPMTGLANRILLLDRVNRSLKLRQRESNHGFSLFYIDLDDFKRINDELGHAVGDRILIQTAKRLKPLFRDQDTISRWGGDEFIVLLDGVTDEKSVTKKAQHLHEIFSYPFQIDEHEFFITASVGTTMSSIPFDKAEDLLLQADQAMYRSKAAGKSQTTVQAPPIFRSVSELNQMEQEIYSAYQNDEFYLVYQPVMDLKRMRITGLEALVRWEHPQKGTLYPRDFFPVAEQCGFTEQLGAWILRQSCDQLSQWRKTFQLNGDLKLHVNISKSQINSSAFQDLVNEMLQTYALEPEILNLECPKEYFLNGDTTAKKNFQSLKNMPGINLVVDNLKMDLGNLNFFFHYRFIPFNMVKIDQNGINYLSTNTTVYDSLRTFISIFSQMGIELAIKGVESQKQLETLKRANCHYGQGYYFSWPLNLQETEAYLANNF